MRIAVLGTGMAGEAIATKLVETGHEVRLGSRTADNTVAMEWAGKQGARASHGTFAEAAGFGELVFNCTPGEVSLAVLEAAGQDAFADKILVDVANPLDASQGFPPVLSISNTDSLAEQIQKVLPSTHVVKALNTVNAAIMVDPQRLPGRHDLFVAGDSHDAKRFVSALLAEFGWRADDIHDVGGLQAARGLEMYLPLWLSLMSSMGSAEFNIHVVRTDDE